MKPSPQFICSFFLTTFLFLSVHSRGQIPTQCFCFEKFTTAIEGVDTSSIEKLDSALLYTFNELKENDIIFKRCSDYLSLSYSFWTMGKMHMLFENQYCQPSEKVKWLIKNGPIIYEMGFMVEKEVKTREKDEDYNIITDSIRWESMLRYYSVHWNNELTLTDEQILDKHHPNYLDFMGKEYVIKNARFMEKQTKLEYSTSPMEQAHSFIEQGEVLSTVFMEKIEVVYNDQKRTATVKWLAFSTNSGEKWHFVNLRQFKLDAVSAIFPFLNSTALVAKRDGDLANKYPASNPQELAEYFCDCMGDAVEKKNMMKEMGCSKIISTHPIWKQKELKPAVYEAVKKTCPENTKTLIFSFYNFGK